jgi:sulfate adenylyltransferase subunit 1
MDRAQYKEEVFLKIQQSFLKVKETLPSGKFHFIPLSALKGDNVVLKSANMQWYNGPSLLELLESEIGVGKKTTFNATRFSVQGVLRNEINNKNIRGAFGKLLSGVLTKEGSVTITPGRTDTKIKRIFINGNEVDQIEHGQSAIVVLEDDVDFARGSLIVNNEELPSQVNAISAYLCCFENLVNDPSKRYILRLHSSENTCIVKNIDFKYTNDFSVKNQKVNSLKMNDIALVGLQFSKKISVDSYAQNKFNGRFILIDPVTNSTVGCGIIV